MTRNGVKEKAHLCFDDALSFDLSPDSREVRVALRGQLPDGGGEYEPRRCGALA